jgi:hypothetical protein
LNTKSISDEKVTSQVNSARDLLKSAAPTEFTRTLLQRFDLNLNEYMQQLFSYIPVGPMEQELCLAFTNEFSRLGISQETSTRSIEFLEKTRSIQTGPHTTLSNGPAFFGANWLTTLGLSSNSPCIIGTISGMPFNNDAKPGSLNYGNNSQIHDFIDMSYPNIKELIKAEAQRKLNTLEQRISLVPESLKHVSVYGSNIPDKTISIVPYFTTQINKFLPKHKLQLNFATLSLAFSANIESMIFNRQIIFVDLCAITSDYLQLIFQNENHIITRLCFDGDYLDNLESLLGKLPLFSQSGLSKKPFSQYFRKDSFISNNSERIKWDSLTISNQLNAGNLCPGLFLIFLSIAFINHFQCFGGFNQVEYLNKFSCALSMMDLFQQCDIKSVPTNALVTGRMTDKTGSDVHPLDVISGTAANFDPSRSVGQFATSLVMRKRWSK